MFIIINPYSIINILVVAKTRLMPLKPSFFSHHSVEGYIKWNYDDLV